MIKPKEAAGEVIRTLPDDVSFDEIIYHLYIRDKISRAMTEKDEELVNQEDAEKLMAKWIVE